MLLLVMFISVVVCAAEISEFHSVFPPFLCLSRPLENLSAVSLDACDNFSFSLLWSPFLCHRFEDRAII